MDEALLTHQLKDYFQGLSHFGSTKALERSLIYRGLKNEIERVAGGIEYGFYAPPIPLKKKPFYRVVAWNLERGLEFDGILHLLQNHPELSRGDVYLFSETDIGMARTQNRNVARELAGALGMNYFFAPSYLNLCKGNAVEDHVEGENSLSLHGNSLMSRYPLENLRIVSLANCKDKMKGKEKRIGCQKTLLAEVSFPFKKVTVACVHLDAHSSQRQRGRQTQTVLDALKENPHPVLLGGDLNTSSYNARHAFFAFCGFWFKVFHGADRVIEEHYTYPDRFYDRHLFRALRDAGMNYRDFNEPGVGTLHYTVEDMRGNYLLQEVVPEWCRKVAENKLKKHGGRASFKLDWFAARGLRSANGSSNAVAPKVVGGLRVAGKPVSDHDAIMVDVDVYS